VGGGDLMMHNPLVTVLMSVYNGEEFLSESIESVLGQTFQNIEFLIIDDGSTDGSAEIINKYSNNDSRIVFIKKNNTGLTDSLNIGLRHASGEWIARLDADDIALPNRLQDQLNFVVANKDVSLLGGRCVEIDQTGMEVKKHSYPSDHNILMKHLRSIKKFFPHSSAFFNKQIVVDLGGYNERFRRSQDCDLWLRIGEIGRIACLDVPVIKLRKHFNMISNTNNGRLQTIMGMCAVICHLRRKKGLSDPSRMDENRLREFLDWLEKRMEQEGVFQERRSWQAIRDVYYNHNENKIKGAKAVATYLSKNPKELKTIWKRFLKTDFALELAEQSKNIW